MSCCAGALLTDPALYAHPDELRAEEFRRSGRMTGEGLTSFVLTVAGIHCGACIRAIETALLALPGIVQARVNFSTRRVTVTADARLADPFDVVRTVEALGYGATLGSGDAATGSDPVLADLMRSLVVAGFAATNVMLLSVSVWSGADGTTRTLFQLVSGLVAIPAVLYAGRPFFRSAFAAISNRHVNMDVPISLGVLLTLVLSLYEATIGGGETWFDASITLVFFLLIGRVLDRAMREKARSGIDNLSRMAARGAMRLGPDGELDYVDAKDIAPGMVLRVACGERFPVDGLLVGTASTDVDRSMATGESLPVALRPGERIEAGALNLSAPVTIEATSDAEHSLVAEMIRMMEAAEQGKASYVRLADRAASLYAPLVHLTALLTFAGWMIATGDAHAAITAAIAVLIVTCPCALGLAVPVAQVVGSSLLMSRGVLVRTGSAFERMAEIRQVAFDKTGTLTLPRLSIDSEALSAADLAQAAALAAESRHPLSVAVVALARQRSVKGAIASDIGETAGYGLDGVVDGRRARLGRRDFVAALAKEPAGPVAGDLWFGVEGSEMIALDVRADLRAGTAAVMQAFDDAGLPRHLLSGDSPASVSAVAARLGFDPERAAARMSPADKADRIEALSVEGGPVLFVGDGINDAPALGRAHVSITPAEASEIGRSNADFVFTGQSLDGVLSAFTVSRRVIACVRQNFAIAIAYNVLAVPLAMAGYVTPLLAAVAMSTSSLIVVANALRLRYPIKREARPAPTASPLASMELSPR